MQLLSCDCCSRPSLELLGNDKYLEEHQPLRHLSMAVFAGVGVLSFNTLTYEATYAFRSRQIRVSLGDWF